MNPLPPLTDAELGLLRESIEQDGVKYPVLLDRAGDIIDGFHRKQITSELGIPCPTETLDVDQGTADRLRVTLNLARRHLSRLDRAEIVAWLASKHEGQARAEAKERVRTGASLGGQSKGCAGQEHPFDKPKLRTDDVVAERINEDLAKMGETMRVTRSTVEKARAVSRLSADTKQQIREGKTSVDRAAFHPGTRKKAVRPVKTGMLRDRPGRDQDLGELARIRAVDTEHQYNSMLNAPAQKLNLPLIRRAEKIMEMLTELIALDPAMAAGQLPIERCREFTVAHAAWWSEFARHCEERRAAETPHLQPRPFRPVNAVLNSVVLGGTALPTEERALSPGERAVLDWVRAQDEPVTATQVAVGLRNRSRQTIMLRIRKLAVSSLIEPAGKAGKETAYQAAAPQPLGDVSSQPSTNPTR